MKASNSERLSYAVRRNKGTTEFPFYRTELCHLLSTNLQPTNMVSLEETDRLYSVYLASAIKCIENKQMAFRERWKYEDQSWIATCKIIGPELSREVAILFVGPYEYCGAVKVEAGTVLADPQPLLEFDKDTIGLHSLTVDSGLFLDLFEEDSVWFIELVAWGQWKSIAEKHVVRPLP